MPRQCKTCGREWLWDSECDSFCQPDGIGSHDTRIRINCPITVEQLCQVFGVTLEQDALKKSAMVDEIIVHACRCEQLLGVGIHVYCEGMDYAYRTDWPDWRGVDWFSKENCYMCD